MPDQVVLRGRCRHCKFLEKGLGMSTQQARADYEKKHRNYFAGCPGLLHPNLVDYENQSEPDLEIKDSF